MRLDPPSLVASVERAQQLARAKQHHAMNEAHLLRAQLHSAGVRELVAKCDVDVRVLEVLADRLVEAQARRRWFDPRTPRDRTRALAAACSVAVEGAPLEDLVFVRVLESKPVQPLLDDMAEASLFAHALDGERVSVSKNEHATRSFSLRAKLVSSQGTWREDEVTVPPSAQVSVVLHNDHFTAMEFVVEMLREVFELEEQDAVALMLRVHKSGRAVLGPSQATARWSACMA
jgi:hypothetical protein